jgi:hypothetical protein
MNTEQFSKPPVEILEPWGRSGPDAEKEALESIQHLWKLDDPEWVEKRDQDWKLIQENVFSDTPKKERKIYESYFKYGRKEEFFGGVTTIILTPYENVEKFELIYRSQLLDAGDRNSVFSRCIYIYEEYKELDWYEAHAKIMMDSLLKDTYVIVEEVTSPRHKQNLSPEPSSWVSNFVFKTFKAIRSNVEWIPAYECINYFISILPYADYEKFRKKMKFHDLLEVIDEGVENGSFTGRAKLFAEDMSSKKNKILEAWEIGEQKIAAGLEVIRE